MACPTEVGRGKVNGYWIIGESNVNLNIMQKAVGLPPRIPTRKTEPREKGELEIIQTETSLKHTSK